MKFNLTKNEYGLLCLILDFPIGMFESTSNPNHFFDKFGVHESDLERIKNKIDTLENNYIADVVSLELLEEEYAELVR